MMLPVRASAAPSISIFAAGSDKCFNFLCAVITPFLRGKYTKQPKHQCEMACSSRTITSVLPRISGNLSLAAASRRQLPLAKVHIQAPHGYSKTWLSTHQTLRKCAGSVLRWLKQVGLHSPSRLLQPQREYDLTLGLQSTHAGRLQGMSLPAMPLQGLRKDPLPRRQLDGCLRAADHVYPEGAGKPHTQIHKTQPFKKKRSMD